MMNNLDRNAIAFSILPKCVECGDESQAADLAFQIADKFLQRANQGSQPITKILIEWDGKTWELYSINPNFDELAFVKGKDFVILPLNSFFSAFSKALKGGFPEDA